MEWISVQDRKPPFDTPVLATDGEHVLVSEYVEWFKGLRVGVGHGCGMWDVSGVYGYDLDYDINYHYITHWAEIPALPKG